MMPDWTDDADDTIPTGQLIDYLLSRLKTAPSAEEYYERCAELVLLAKDMNAEEIEELSQAVRKRPKAKRGAPTKTERDQLIRDRMNRSPTLNGVKIGGLHGLKRQDVIQIIMKDYQQSEETARKTYDKVKKAAEQDKMAYQKGLKK